MTDQTNDVLELTEAVPEDKPSLIETIGKEFLLAGGRAALTSAGITVGVGTGLLSIGAFGLAAEFINAVATNNPGDPATAFAVGVAFQAPFIHHIFKGGLPERLTGEANPNGAFTKATKATSYTAGAIGALLAAAALMTPTPDDGMPTRGLDQNFEHHPSRMHEAKRKMTIAHNATGPVVTLG